MFHFLEVQLETELFVYSEYFGPEYQSGELVGGIRHEDLQATSFADESFDIVITCDVFEHIPNPIVAEREVVRILKAGGIYCFTVPCIPDGEQDLVLAEVTSDGEIKYFAEPQYHGDPVRPNEGILVYRIFSFRDLKQRFEELGCGFTSYRLWSRALGIIDSNGWVLVVNKTREVSKRQAKEAQREIELNRLTTSMSGPERELGLANDGLNEVYSLLSRQRDVLNWIQTSRAWRLTSHIQNLWLFGNRMQAFAARVQSRLGLGGAIFHGEIDLPLNNEIVGRRLEVRGWVYSTAAPVIRVEAFLGTFYLGTLKYGVERPDIADRFSPVHAMRSGYAESLLLPTPLQGRKVLTLRSFDALGHVYVASRLLT